MIFLLLYECIDNGEKLKIAQNLIKYKGKVLTLDFQLNNKVKYSTTCFTSIFLLKQLECHHLFTVCNCYRIYSSSLVKQTQYKC